ncbi:hypothetical protein QYF36_008625 [Acer negundo]|nr:hypothetical protein QYF36_008625 [Acer negundo]
MKSGIGDFVKVKFDSTTNKPTVIGYCIDVFDAVMKTLPYAVTYEYIPFGLPDGSSTRKYNDLIYHIYLGAKAKAGSKPHRSYKRQNIIQNSETANETSKQQAKKKRKTEPQKGTKDRAEPEKTKKERRIEIPRQCIFSPA